MIFEERMDWLKENIQNFAQGQTNTEANLQQEFNDEFGDKCPWCESGPLDVLVNTYDNTIVICCGPHGGCGMSTPWCKTFHEAYTYLQAMLEAKKKLDRETKPNEQGPDKNVQD